MMFSVVVGQVGGARVPEKLKLFLSLLAAEPVEAEPNHFGMMLDDGIVEETYCCGVVCLEWGSRLGLTDFSQGMAEGYHFQGGVIQGGKLCLNG